VTAIQRSRLLWNVCKYSVLLWARLWLRIRFEGRHHVPRQGPVLLVANHSSFLDPPFVGIMAPRWVVFLARDTLARLWPMRWWLRHVGVVLIDRQAPSKEVLKTLAGFLAEGNCVGLFPEGTRSPDGAVGSFRGGLELLLRRSGAPVVPVGIDGGHRALPRGAFLPRPRKVVVRVGAPWTAARVLANGGIDALRAEVAALARAPLRDPASDGSGPGPSRTDTGHSAAVRS
jgi:1-acyl-sn-glycerol-3-phosphate acyltransferase